ncbi:MAG: hypothetical protein JKX99_04905, partial [Robiginitomaculum sp.]|nr:hypothetical protein [Robiginitomaculum sp.]
LSWYTAAPVSTVWVSPTSLGSQKIGHMGAFSRKNIKFWDHPLSWFNEFIDKV